jgi:hypothetical protein
MYNYLSMKKPSNGLTNPPCLLTLHHWAWTKKMK